MLTETESDFINDDFAEEITYYHWDTVTLSYAAGVTVSAIVSRNFPYQEPYPGSGIERPAAQIHIGESDVTPNDRDRYYFDGKYWDIWGDRYSKNGVIYTVTLIRDDT
ncbi:MAG: hypothetical protein ACU83N_10040 [Gammaproteobacteria bacterium]